MTKYILHGGETSAPNIHNRNFYREMFKATKGKPVLMCYYSRPQKEWEYLLKSDMERMKKAVGKKKFEVIVASKDSKKFIGQIKECEAVYFRGGDTVKLMKKLDDTKRQLKKAFQGRTVLGSSAGAIMLAKYFYNQDGAAIFKGFGLLPVKIMTHYLSKGKYASASGKENLALLKDYKEKLPVYAIKETEYIIVKN